MNPLFLAAIEMIYDSSADPSRWPRALQAIADVFGDVGANLIWRRDDGSFGNIVSPRLQDALEHYDREEWWRQDIRASRSHEFAFQAHGGAITDRHVATPQELDTHPIYTQFLARHGLRWSAGIEISPDPTVSVAISLQRAGTKPPYTTEELETFTQLGRHAEKSLRLSIRLFDAELTRESFAETFARLGLGVFVLDSLNRVVFSNPAAGKLSDGLTLVNGRLLVAEPSDREALDTAIAKMSRGTAQDLAGQPKPILIRRSSSPRPLMVYVLPVGGASDHVVRFLAHASVIVLVIDPQADDPFDPAMVRDVFGLTLGEARIAALVGTGLSPRESAEKLRISEATARTVLKRVFAKVGVSRQNELAALLSKLVLR